MGFHQFGVVSRTVIAENSILGHFGPPKRGFRVLGTYYFYIIARKRHSSIIIDNRNLFIYGVHQFAGVSVPLFLKNSILDHFGPRERGFRVLGAYYFDIIARKRPPSVIIHIRNLFIYGFHQFRGVSGPLLLKKQNFGPFWATKKEFSGPNGPYYAYIIPRKIHPRYHN